MENQESQCMPLNDHCLEHIFSFLDSLRDRFHCERVCKQWQRVSQRAWHSFNTLDITGEPAFIVEQYDYNCLLNVKIVSKTLKKCGRYLKKIIYRQTHDYMAGIDYKKSCAYRVMHSIGEFCPNLRIVALEVSKRKILKSLAINSTNIVKLYLILIDESTSYRNELSLLYLRNTNLKLVDLSYYSKDESMDLSLMDLPADTIESLILRASSLPSIMLKKVITRLENLTRLHLYFIDHLDDNILEAIGTKKGLEEIHINTDDDTTSLRPITRLTNLKILNLAYCNFVNDEFLMSIVCNCKELSDVSIEGCRNVTDLGLTTLSSLTKLNRLVISITRVHFSENALCEMPALKHLNVRNCVYLTEKKCLKVLKTYKSLTFLNLTENSGISNKLVNFAIEETKKRTNNLVLELCVSRCLSVNLEKINNDSPNLKILTKDPEDTLDYWRLTM